MSLGARLKEERLRLRFNQTDLAAMAGASKGALINWEKGTNSPPASAFEAFAEAGVDISYVLTGKPMENPTVTSERIDAELNDIHRLLAEPDEAQKDAESFGGSWLLGRLDDLRKATRVMTLEQRTFLDRLNQIARNAENLEQFRRDHFERSRQNREGYRDSILGLVKSIGYKPGAVVVDRLVGLAYDRSVPTHQLAALVWDIVDEVRSQFCPASSAEKTADEDHPT